MFRLYKSAQDLLAAVALAEEPVAGKYITTFVAFSQEWRVNALRLLSPCLRLGAVPQFLIFLGSIVVTSASVANFCAFSIGKCSAKTKPQKKEMISVFHSQFTRNGARRLNRVILCIATLLLKDHLVSFVDDLSDADDWAFNREVIEFNDMSLTFNADLEINDLIRLHGVAICEDAFPSLFPFSPLMPRERFLGIRGVATSATVHHSIYLALLESLIVRRCKVRRRVA